MEAVAAISTPPDIPAKPRSWDLLGWLFLRLVPQAQLFRYSCPGCFEYLWSLLSDEEIAKPRCDCMHEAVQDDRASALQADPTARVFVIGYDDIPANYARPQSIPNIHLDTIFSPTTLFMLLARKLARQRTVDQLRFIVVDPHGVTRGDKTTLGISQLLAPQLQIVDGSEAVLLSAIEQAEGPVMWDELKVQAAKDHLKLVLTAPGSRHAVSNIVGPVLLGFQPEEPDVAWIVSHLKYVLSAIGLAPTEETNVLIPSEEEREELKTLGATEFVLLDDQHQNGWAQIVKEALGVEEWSENEPKPKSRTALSIHSSPEFLVRKLERAATSKKDLRFGLTIGKRNFRNEILLLDLRLFEGASLQEEAKFFSRVLALAERLCAQPGLPWPGFSQHELTRLKTWLEAVTAGKASRSDKVYLEALSLFPRVLSLTDFSLPIVIFSSTGQREITERLKCYGNIITEFEKPRFFGYQSHDLLTQTRKTFWSAINKALLLCRGRSLCVDVIRAGQNLSLGNKTDMKWARHFELYLDESGSASRDLDPDANRGRQRERFVIAGLLVPYESALGNGPRALHHKMEDAGLRWWPNTETDPYLLKRESHRPGLDLPAGAPRPTKDIIDDFLKCTAPIVPSAVCLEYSKDIRIEETDNVRLQWRGDNRYRHVLSDLLELILFDFLPTLELEPESTLSIFVATRYRSHDEFKHQKESVKRIRELFGYAGDDLNQRYKTIEESSIISVLFEVLARRHPVPLGIQIEHARGVTLFYPEYQQSKTGTQSLRTLRPRWNHTRHQHYLADLIAHHCYTVAEKSEANPFQTLFANGVYDKKDRRLAAFMLAARMIARGNIADALLAIKDSNYRSPLSAASCAAILFHNISTTVKEKLNGNDFLQLVAGLQQEKQLSPDTPFEQGSIVAFDETTYTGMLACQTGARLPFDLHSWRSATFPTLGEVVKFKRSQTSSGKPTAVSVRSVI